MTGYMSNWMMCRSPRCCDFRSRKPTRWTSSRQPRDALPRRRGPDRRLLAATTSPARPPTDRRPLPTVSGDRRASDTLGPEVLAMEARIARPGSRGVPRCSPREARSGHVGVFDGHNDTLNARGGRRGRRRPTVRRGLRRGPPGPSPGGGRRLGGGLFAVMAPSPPGDEMRPCPRRARGARRDPARRRHPLPHRGSFEGRLCVVRTVRELLACRRGARWRPCSTSRAPRPSIRLGRVRGLLPRRAPLPRPVWSRANAFGHGVPFAFGTSPDTGPA